MTYEAFLAQPGMKERVQRLLAFTMAEGATSNEQQQVDVGMGIDAMLWTIGVLTEISPATQNPRALRIASEQIGKNLHAMLRAQRERTQATGRHPLEEYGKASVIANDPS